MQKARPSESFAHGAEVGDCVVDEELSECAGEGEAAEVEEALRVAQHEGRRRQQLTRPAQRDQAQDRCRGVDACRPNNPHRAALLRAQAQAGSKHRAYGSRGIGQTEGQAGGGG